MGVKATLVDGLSRQMTQTNAKGDTSGAEAEKAGKESEKEYRVKTQS